MSNFDLTTFFETLSDGDRQYFTDHKKRFEQSLEWIRDIVSDQSHVLEIGSPNMFTTIFEKTLKCGKYCNTWQDLRKPLEFTSGVFDVVLFMEVIEHVKDLEEVGGYNETFHGVGQLNLLEECFRVLKPDGLLFLTTPNVNSFRSLRHLLIYEHPYTYWHHIREMSQMDLRTYLNKCGFTTLRFESLGSWYNVSDKDVELMEALSKFGFSKELREDNLFVVAKKYG